MTLQTKLSLNKLQQFFAYIPPNTISVDKPQNALSTFGKA